MFEPKREPGLEVVVDGVIGAVSVLTEGVVNSTDGLLPVGSVDEAWVTHYGESFNGQPMGCDGTLYSSEDAGIVAVGPTRYGEWPCGTVLRICGPGGCLVAQRTDACPGCGPNHVDLSEQGLRLVCGADSGVCKAHVDAFALACDLPPARQVSAGDDPLRFVVRLAEVALEDRTARLLDLSDGAQRDACTLQADPTR